MNEERLLQVLLAPQVSEKGSRVSEQHNQVVFKVRTDATKAEVKAAVEKIFNVKVTSVTILNVAGKSRRFGRHQGRTSNWKKAYVRMIEGDQIDMIGAP